ENLRRRNRITLDPRDRRRADKDVFELAEPRRRCGTPGERVLDDLVGRLGAKQLCAQLLQLVDAQPAVLGEDDGRRAAQLVANLLNDRNLLRPDLYFVT